MAKVYDALRRAEQERRRLTGAEDATVTAPEPAEWEPIGHVVPPTRKRFWKRASRRRSVAAAVQHADLNKRRIALLQPDSFVAEQYRTLRGRIDALSSQRPVRTLAVVSALPREGKTTAAINLASVTALSLGRRVLLVDCDLRRPQVHSSLGIHPEAGLAELLCDRVGLDQAISKVEGFNLEVIGVREKPENPSELLGSERMKELVQELAQRYDRVILDTPAALGLPDAKAIAEICDGVVIVARASSTPQAELEALLDLVDRRRVLGLVLNGVEQRGGRYGYAS
jgi:capsular exopolysaccharide synthesis family protein